MSAPSSGPSFLALLTHELRNPLNVVCGYAEAMAAQTLGPLSEDYRRAADRLALAARQASALVSDLQFLADVECGDWKAKPEPLEPSAQAQAAIALMAPQYASAVRLRTTGAATAEADPRALRHVLLNLLDNAARHGAGPITLRLEAGEGDRLVVEVENAVGASAPGSGLGLRLVGALAAAHGGAFSLDIAGGRARARAILGRLR